MRLQVESLALLSELRIWRCRELWCGLQTRLGSCVVWLWRRPVAAAPIGPLAWEPPYATGAAQEMAKKKKRKGNSEQLPYDTRTSFLGVSPRELQAHRNVCSSVMHFVAQSGETQMSIN